VAGTCDCGNELSGSIKCGEFLDWVKTCSLLKNDSAPWIECSILSDVLKHTSVLF